ncbi:MAG: hypothetical protein ACOCZE_02875 [Planctomycetota bacterium]
MKKFAILALAAGLVLTVGGCSKDHEDVVEEQIELMNKTADVLATIKDKESAQAAKDDLEELGEKMKELKAEMDEMDEPSEEEEKALKEKYGKEMEKAGGRLIEQVMRIAMNPELQKALGDSMDALKPE